MLQSEREALFNTVQDWQGYRDPVHLLRKRGTLCLFTLLYLVERARSASCKAALLNARPVTVQKVTFCLLKLKSPYITEPA